MKIETFIGGYDRNYSYLIYNEKTKEALVVDPFSNIEIYYKTAEKLDLAIIGVLNTHNHFDHVEGNAIFESKHVPIIKKEMRLGENTLKIISTPGHTPDSVCFLVEGNLFSGDTLFVGKVGGTSDVKDSKQEYESLQKLMELPEGIKIYPGHNYGDKPTSTISFEKENNPFLLCKSFEEFFHLKQHWLEYKAEHGID